MVGMVDGPTREPQHLALKFAKDHKVILRDNLMHRMPHRGPVRLSWMVKARRTCGVPWSPCIDRDANGNTITLILCLSHFDRRGLPSSGASCATASRFQFSS